MSVFLDYDQPALDRQYDQAAWAPNAQAVIRGYGEASEAVRRQIGEPRSYAYGPGPEEVLDLYPPPAAGAPLLAFVHGGAWRRKMRRESLFAAEPFLRAGAGFAAVGFDALPSCSLEEMVHQVSAALGWLRTNHAGKLVVCGHSSGAHLAACALTRVEGLSAALLVSGIYDLRPVRLSSRNDYARIDDRIEEDLSPIRQVAKLRLPVVVAWGEHESPEFARQSAEYAAALGVRGLCVPGMNHFEVIRTLAEPDSRLCAAALALLG